MKKARPKKPISGKALARLITVLVFVASIALVAFTVNVFTKTLTRVANTRIIDTNKAAKLAGIDGVMLDSLLQFHAERVARNPMETFSLNNPFIKLPPPPEPVAPPPPPAAITMPTSSTVEGQAASETAPAPPQ